MTYSPASPRPIRLGVNIDHVATLRNARGGDTPSVQRAARLCMENGADSITIHLREDRRHIRDNDVYALKEWGGAPLNLELAVTDEMITIACAVRPEWSCLVPENRLERTTEGGLDVLGNHANIRACIKALHEEGVKVSLFIAPDPSQLEAAQSVGADAVELHTGHYATLWTAWEQSKGTTTSLASGQEAMSAQASLEREGELFQESARWLKQAGIGCHIGHGLTYENIVPLLSLPALAEVNIGHFLIGESVFVGLPHVIAAMRHVLDQK